MGNIWRTTQLLTEGISSRVRHRTSHKHYPPNFYHRHSTLELTKVNTYGLLYRWKGTDDSLKPLLLLSHQGKIEVAIISLRLSTFLVANV